MDLQFLCFAFCGLALIGFFLGIRIGSGMAQKRCERRINHLIRALERIHFHGDFSDDKKPPFRCRPMTVDDAVKIAEEALKKDAELEMGEKR